MPSPNARLLAKCWAFTFFFLANSAIGQDDAPPPRGSLIEDRAARKLIDAGDARYEVDELAKAVEIWQSVIERYPRSPVRYLAHMRLGNYFLERDRAYDQGRGHFEIVAAADNRDTQQRAEATLKFGICFYHDRNYGKCFQVMRDVIQSFPTSPQVNQAYYYIGLGHFQLGHYSRAIDALQKVGTTLGSAQDTVEKLEAGKRLFVKIEDADLAVLSTEDKVSVRCESSGGDSVTVECFLIGRNVRIALGSVPTRLGKPDPSNGILEIKGGDAVKVIYTDQHTATGDLDNSVLKEVVVVGNAHVQITDGAFSDRLRGVVLGKSVNVQIADADGDRTGKADSIKAIVEVHRLKSDEELEAEAVEAAAERDASGESEEDAKEIDPYKLIDRTEVVLTEVAIATPELDVPPPSNGETSNVLEIVGSADAKEETQPNPAVDGEPLIHTGIFRVVLPLEKSDTAKPNDKVLQAIAGDQVRVVYLDELHRGEGVRQLLANARCLEGNVGGVRVTQAVITDAELRIQTKLKTANALTNIGNRYKEFGLKTNAMEKYEQALVVCEEVTKESQKLGGRMLEQSYVQIWKIYFEMDRLNLAAAMCARLQREFPSSGFVDDALLQLADVARKQGELNRAIGIYNRLVGMKTSQLRGEAQFGVAACFDQMADEAEARGVTSVAQMRDKAFQEYKKVFDDFPESGRVGEAVAKMANYYYQQKDYSRAIDTFETVLAEHPDAKFLDVILFNYGRCLFRMGRKASAQARFDQLIGEFPESPLAPDAKRISEALSPAVASPSPSPSP
ncbi:MAG TPA: tetratricopeptide repeat protein [Planctomycetaceae bacterium]|nr:tetratricopeptide repeat protein [Planctomycetaceae bacterium]